jgi:hypothetical protein
MKVLLLLLDGIVASLNVKRRWKEMLNNLSVTQRLTLRNESWKKGGISVKTY